MVSGNTADILSSDYLTGSLVLRGSSAVIDQSFYLKEDSPLAQSLSFHRSFPKRLGCSLEASTAIGLWSLEESRLLITQHYTAGSNVVSVK